MLVRDGVEWWLMVFRAMDVGLSPPTSLFVWVATKCRTHRSCFGTCCAAGISKHRFHHVQSGPNPNLSRPGPFSSILDLTRFPTQFLNSSSSSSS